MTAITEIQHLEIEEKTRSQTVFNVTPRFGITFFKDCLASFSDLPNPTVDGLLVFKEEWTN